MSVITRFAPSPTGFLHIGGARTALFNWLFARHHGGKFLLRIEDTDRARSTTEAVEAIFDGLRWLGLAWDGEAVMQSQRADRHAEVARDLLRRGLAYHCYASPEELTAMREEQRAAGLPMRYDGRWRDRPASEAPADRAPVIRLKAPTTGDTVIRDHVQGEVRIANEQLDDMVLLRADGTPTYMLSVVVDDHDMSITHVIRGDDHLTNAFRQMQIYKAMEWAAPEFAHIPLIHGPDGAKLSKRHGALGVDAYRDMGYLPEAVRNYLLRLGWSHGDEEIIDTGQAIAWFDLDAVGRSAARFDFAKLTNLNGHYLRRAEDGRLADMVAPRLEAVVNRQLTDEERGRIVRGMGGLKERARTLVDLAESAAIYLSNRALQPDEKAAGLLMGESLGHLAALAERYSSLGDWRKERLEELARNYADERGLKLGKIAQPLRAAVTGLSISPPVFEVLEILGRAETLARIKEKTGNGSHDEKR